MSNITAKPKLTSNQLIQKMKNEKGIQFNIISEKEAESYLLDSNNYLRTASYRKNYQKYTNGSNKGKYINLDFAYLKELSVIDFHFRSLVSKMCIDIEHDLKVKMLKEIENNALIDGYEIVDTFLKSNQKIVGKLEGTINSPFTGDLIQKYFTVTPTVNPNTGRTIYNITSYSDCPVWVLFELITFGDLIIFFVFYKANYSTNIKMSKNVLNLVKSLRNASAHNNCIIACLNHKTSGTPAEISQKVASVTTINTNQRQKKLSQRPTLEFVALLYAYDLIVSEKVKSKGVEELKSLVFVRMSRNKNYFADNDLIKSSYEFICKVVSNFF